MVSITNAGVLPAIAACLFLQPTLAYGASQHRHSSHSVNQDVQPSAEIEERVTAEVAKAKRILDGLDTNDFLDSPYLVSAVYYHDDFLTDFPVDRQSADPERRIIGQISKMLSPELKVRFVGLLHQVWAGSKPEGSAQFVDPLRYASSAGGGRSHKYAIDLFAAEGTPVQSVSRGVVMLAEGDWSRDNLFSTSSRKGGNVVIVFDPDENRFYRYCHLQSVLPSPGQIVASGDKIATVGHTGLNASQPGHGQHLHFEANQYVDGHVRAIDYRGLRTMLRRWQTASR